MTALFLIAALALPVLPQNSQTDFYALREFLEARYPKYHIVYVNEKETLLNKGAEASPVYVKGLRIWTIRRAA